MKRLRRFARRSFFLACAGVMVFSALAQAEGPTYESRFGLIRVGGFILFFDSKGPLSYQLLTFADLPENVRFLGEVEGKSCQYGLSIPIFHGGGTQRTNISAARGNGGYTQAMKDIQSRSSELDGIFDVKVDVHKFSILGIYRRECTEITARGFSLRTQGQ